MDIEIKKKGFRLTGKQWIYAAVAVAVIVVLIIAVYGNRSSVMRIDRESVTTGDVIAGEFNDYIRVVGQVQPVTSLQLSPEEGGIVEQIFLEEGAAVKKGDPIVKLRNSNLDLEILNYSSRWRNARRSALTSNTSGCIRKTWCRKKTT